MGSRMMEPEEFWAFADYVGDTTSETCLSNRTISGGIFQGHSPIGYYVPLLLLQMSLASVTILLTSMVLKPLGQPLMVAQILGGILLGPSFLGRSKIIARALFPLESFLLLDVIAVLAIMFYFFLIGVYMDTWIVKKIGKKAYTIGLAAAFGSTFPPLFGFYYLYDYITDPVLLMSVGYVMRTETLFTFPIIARYLYELNILNSEFGALALSSSIVGGILSILYQIWRVNGYEIDIAAVLQYIAFMLGILFVVQPVALWLIKRNKEGYTASICSIFIAVLVSGLVGYFIGFHIAWGPFILGLAIPPGPPLGATLVDRLEIIVSWILMPIFFLKIGLAINIYVMEWSNILNVGIIIIIGCLGKSMAAFIAGLSCKLPFLDAVSLSLVVNVKGVLELTLVKIYRRKEKISNEIFVLLCTSMLITTMVITILLKAIYNPSKRYLIYNRRSIMDTKPSDELRLLVCIHREESVPSLVNILEASNHTQQSPLAAYILHLVDLIGRATPIFISHKSSMYTSSKAQVSKHILNAFEHYKENHKDTMSLSVFTAITPPAAMHDEVCKLALEKRGSLVILPFHEQRASRGSISEKSRVGSRSMNIRVLENAPCSVGILVERGLWNCSNTASSALSSWFPFRVVVLFFGGPDDREALVFGARMSGHTKVNLMVIRILTNHDEFDEKLGEIKIDDDMISTVRYNMADNDRFKYIEETVMDGSGTLRVIQSVKDDCQLIMVGRNHDRDSPATTGLAEWNQFRELGTIGDLLASPDFMSDAMILVIQQHSTHGRKFT
ncbi:cation/H(+) antiporter 15-like [Macadamia integrifolia]|uniref:cation/H(+) antiporter 15-like n=1 Tax=Macadamia integrifolia TaxID=60698 RepID=UPI001C4FCE8B|nr:cation/H(+) antiporter 15-like [Macadamia integrifolia]